MIGDSALQLQAFAAPRSGGLWDEIRAEIAAAVETQGGTAEEHVGVARHRAAHPDAVRRPRRPHRLRARDLPRGRRARAGSCAGCSPVAPPSTRPPRGPLVEVFKAAVVVRGTEPMAPRELLPLALPRDAEAAAAAETAAADAEDEAERTSLDPFQRGPEITEVR